MLSPGTACSVNYSCISDRWPAPWNRGSTSAIWRCQAQWQSPHLRVHRAPSFKDLSDDWVLPIHHFADLLVLKFGIELFGHADSRLGLSFLLFPVCKLNELNSIEKMTATNKTAKRTHICKRYHNSKV